MTNKLYVKLGIKFMVVVRKLNLMNLVICLICFVFTSCQKTPPVKDNNSNNNGASEVAVVAPTARPNQVLEVSNFSAPFATNEVSKSQMLRYLPNGKILVSASNGVSWFTTPNEEPKLYMPYTSDSLRTILGNGEYYVSGNRILWFQRENNITALEFVGDEYQTFKVVPNKISLAGITPLSMSEDSIFYSTSGSLHQFFIENAKILQSDFLLPDLPEKIVPISAGVIAVGESIWVASKNNELYLFYIPQSKWIKASFKFESNSPQFSQLDLQGLSRSIVGFDTVTKVALKTNAGVVEADVKVVGPKYDEK